MRNIRIEHAVEDAVNYLMSQPNAREVYEDLMAAISTSDLESCASRDGELLLGGLLAMAECMLADKENRETNSVVEDVFFLRFGVESSDGNKLNEMVVKVTPSEPSLGGTAAGAEMTFGAAKYVRDPTGRCPRIP